MVWNDVYRLGWSLFLGALAPTTFIDEARACAACACGDPTLTSMGTEKAFPGRLRVGFRGQSRASTEGVGRSTEVRTTEEQLEVVASYALNTDVTLALEIPAVRRSQEFTSGARLSAVGLGDVALRGRWDVWRGAGARHRLALQGAGVFPTGPTLRGQDGDPVDFDVQASRGAWVPEAGLLYSYFGRAWSAHVSSRWRQPLGGRFGPKPGAAWLTTVMGQYQWATWGALVASADTRWSQGLEREVGRAREARGWILFGSAGLAVMPLTDLLLTLTLRLPVTNTMVDHEESAVVVMGVTFDV